MARSAAAKSSRLARLWVSPRFRWSVRLAGAVVLILLIMNGCNSYFYYPSRTVWYKPKDFGLTHEDVYFKTRDGLKLHGWFLPAAGKPRGTIIHFHGNAENITNHIALSAWLPPEGYNVLIFDYRGYGQSEGKVTRAGTILDGHAAIDYALSRPDVDPQRLFVFGQSLGGAVALWVTAQRPEVKAIVVDSTFGRYRDIAQFHLRHIVLMDWAASGLSHLLISSGYDPLDVIDRISPRPLLVIAAGRDEICPPHLGKAVFDAAREPKSFWLVQDAGHGEAPLLNPQEAARRFNELFEQAR